MGYPELPKDVKAMLADEQVRTHHHLWHFVRNPEAWESLTEEQRREFEAQQWKAPRYENLPGSGIDFLGMHRHMIDMVNARLAVARDPNWPIIKGWDSIPWSEDDPEWPVPEWQIDRPTWATAEEWANYTQLALEMRSPTQIQDMRRIAQQMEDPARLRQWTLDQLGSAIEWTIHGWMHIRWSGAPPKEQLNSNDITNDWLFIPWASHVNKVFWKLHGWIDDRIRNWEAATRQIADFSSAWAGPPMRMPMDFHRADTKFLSLLPSIQGMPLPMRVDKGVIQRLLH